MKKCRKCNQQKSLDDFLKCFRYRDGYFPWCSQCKKDHRKDYYQAHKQDAKEYRQQYDKTHRRERNQLQKKYRDLNPNRVFLWKKTYRTKNQSNPHYRINHSMGVNLRHALKRKKQARHWETIVGYTTEDLIAHLQSKFLVGMSWDNYGEWHIDHIIPKSSFSFVDDKDPEFRMCWALSNLQPLWATDNIKKGNTICV